jgi:hypothetical protein
MPFLFGVGGEQQDVAEADDPADKAAAEPAGAAAAPDAQGYRQAPRGGPGSHRADQGTGPPSHLGDLLRLEQGLISFLAADGGLFFGTADRLATVGLWLQVEHIVREENMMAAQEILELFCELVAVRLPIIETQKFVCFFNSQYVLLERYTLHILRSTLYPQIIGITNLASYLLAPPLTLQICFGAAC